MKKPNRLVSAGVAALIGVPLGGAIAVSVTVPASAAIRICNNAQSEGSLGVQSARTGRWSSLRPGSCTSGIKGATIPNGHHGHTRYGVKPAGYFPVSRYSLFGVTVHDNH